MFGEIAIYVFGAVFVAALVASFLYFVVLGPRRGKKELRRMEADLPISGARHGLQLKAAREMDKYGKLVGRVKDHQVEVCPDDSQQFMVRLKRDISCYISSEKFSRTPQDDQVYFDFFDLDLNEYFKIRHASGELAERFSGTNARIDSLVKLVQEQGKELRLLTINDRIIYASVKQRWPTDFSDTARMYITSEQLDRLLPALIEVAEELDDAPVE